MIDSILSALGHSFFLRSLAIVVILSLVFPLYGNIVVIRQEANIAHTFSHIGLFGVAIGLWFGISIDLVLLASIIFTVILLFFLGKKRSHNYVAYNEIGAQLGLVGAILVVSQMSGYKADISSYLFGDILLLSNQDVYSILAIAIITGLLYLVYSKQWFASSLHQSLAISKGIGSEYSYMIYLLALGLMIGGAMKIVGVLLVSAFLIIPSNTGKLLARNKFSWILSSIIIGVLSSIVALFVSWHLDIPSGASIIACLLVVFGIIKIARTEK